MPTTPGGTVFEVIETTLPMGDRASLMVPASYSATKLVVYTHGNDGSYDQFAQIAPWAGMRRWFMENNWAVVESSGAGNGWGGAASRLSYEQAAAWAMTLVPIVDITVLGRSMGGLVAYWLATSSEFSPLVRNLIINSGTTDLIARYAASGGSDMRAMNAAYGVTPTTEKNEAAFAAAAAGHDPMQFPTGIWGDKRVLQLWGSADTTVIPETHGQAWVTKYGTHTKATVVDVRVNGDHGWDNGSYLQVDAMTSFLTAERPPTGVKKLVRRVWVIADGEPTPVQVFV